MENCIVIGAGMSGLVAAKTLQDAGLSVLVLDKGRRAGGRMASRHFEGAHFDHGAQFYTVRDPEFRRVVDGWLGSALVRPWFEYENETRYYSPLGMNALPQYFAADLCILSGVTVAAARREPNCWRVIAEDGTVYSSETLIVTPPVPQSLALVEIEPAHRRVLEPIEYHRCISLLAVLEGPSSVPNPGYIRVSQEPLQTIADNRMKGLDSATTGVTIHATPAFSLLNWDEPQSETAQLLLAAAEPWLGSPVLHWHYHRWRYSQPVQTYAEPFYGIDGAAPVAFAGDGFGGPRVEGAFVSGLAAANWLLTK